MLWVFHWASTLVAHGKPFKNDTKKVWHTWNNLPTFISIDIKLIENTYNWSSIQIEIIWNKDCTKAFYKSEAMVEQLDLK